jgi:hypothetical protein
MSSVKLVSPFRARHTVNRLSVWRNITLYKQPNVKGGMNPKHCDGPNINQRIGRRMVSAPDTILPRTYSSGRHGSTGSQAGICACVCFASDDIFRHSSPGRVDTVSKTVQAPVGQPYYTLTSMATDRDVGFAAS